MNSYLNMRGCEEEGLYRVPGSAQQVRYYERKFDTGRLEYSHSGIYLSNDA
jgi:hypothetical protein